MEENFIGYLLDALDERTRELVETYLREHAEARAKLALLRQALDPLDADQEAPAPPPQLALRTLGRIAEHICADTGQRPSAGLPHAPPISPSTLSDGGTWWRRADVLVAACVLVLLGGIGLMTLARLHDPRSPAVIADCSNNLRIFSASLQQYRETHGHFPDVTSVSPRHANGMVVLMLIEAGMLSANTSVKCPGNGAATTCPASLDALRSASDAEFAKLAPCLLKCYAYSLGYRDEQAIFHAPGTQPNVALSELPIMADCPPLEPNSWVSNSLNHGGSGQNVLFADGHVTFLPQRKFGNEDDIFLNSEQKVAAGVGPGDIVLGASATALIWFPGKKRASVRYEPRLLQSKMWLHRRAARRLSVGQPPLVTTTH